MAENQLDNSAGKNDKPETIDHLMQGWTEAERKLFYETSQGSRLVPYNWYKNLESADSQKPFNSKEHLDDKLGYLFPADSSDKNQLPIGFVIDDRSVQSTASNDKTRVPRLTDVSQAIPNEKWLGMTCAACHTGQVEHKGIVKRIDGGPANADFSGYTSSMRDAFKATLSDESKFQRFADKVIPAGTPEQHAELKKNVAQYTGALDGLVTRSTPPTPYAHGRLDAFGILLNEITGTAMDKPHNYRVPDAPTSYPPLWGAPNLDWVQWNGSSASPLGRNVGEVLGVFAELDLKEGSPAFSDSTAYVRNLYALEDWLKSLQAPKWPTEFGALNPDKVENGRKLFVSEGCQGCHGTSPQETYVNKYGRELVRTKTVPLPLLGTDSTAATNFLMRKADPGPFKDSLGGKNEVAIGLLLGAAVNKALQTEFKKENILTPQEMLRLNDYRESLNKTPKELLGYKAPSLEGVWATAPYLHNGSVPTLWDLLTPPEQRPEKFMVGSREFDPDKVGFVTDKGKSEINTGDRGNSRLGHNFGTGLEEQQKRDLIEYLKSR